MKIAVIWTGVSEESGSTKLAELLSREVSSRIDVETTHINLRSLATDLASMTVTRVASPKLETALNVASSADILISVCPIYNGVPLGLHSLFFQLLDDGALGSTVVILGGTGGTARHSLAIDNLRLLMSYLKGTVVPTAVFVATDDWASSTFAPAQRIETAVNEALNLAGRPQGPATTNRHDFIPLAHLLGESSTGSP